MNDNVTRIAEKFTSTMEQVTEYIVKPVAMAQYVIEKVKPIVDMVQQKSEEFAGKMEDDDNPKKKKKSGIFKKRK